jgi:hypothetical protein
MDVSGQSIFPIFRGQAVFLAPVDGPSRLSRNVDKKLVKCQKRADVSYLIRNYRLA